MEMSEPTKPRPVQASGAQLLGHGGLVLAHLLPLSCSSSATLLPIWPLCTHSFICLSLLTNLLGLLIYSKMADSACKCLPPDNPQSLYLTSNFLAEKLGLFWLPWSNKLIVSVGKGIVGVYMIDGQTSFTNRKPHRKPPGNKE